MSNYISRKLAMYDISVDMMVYQPMHLLELGFLLSVKGVESRLDSVCKKVTF